VRRVTPLVSVVIATRNRAHLIADAIRAVRAQEPDSPPFELIVVNNGSTDDTAHAIERAVAGDPRVQVVAEPRPGVSHGRNTGIAHARGEIVAFTDDDIRVSSRWVQAIVDGFQAYRDADALGGPVHPVWPFHPPHWLHREAWAPLAIVDYGAEPIIVSRQRPLCLIGANLAIRKSAFQRVGFFSPELPRCQDQEWLERLYGCGGSGVYLPGVVVSAPVDAERLTKRYHWRWHLRRGRFLAHMRLPALEETRIGPFLGVPGHIWRAWIAETAAAALAGLTWRGAAAFAHTCEVLRHTGFILERVPTAWPRATRT
jgi:glucosyl-dolichyl phosphate glucuronosyltransferase